MNSLETQLQPTDPREVVVSASPPQQRAAPWTPVLGALFAVLAFVGCATVLAWQSSPAGATRGSLRHSVKTLGIRSRQDPLTAYLPTAPLPSKPVGQQSGQSQPRPKTFSPPAYRPQNVWQPAQQPEGQQPLNPYAMKLIPRDDRGTSPTASMASGTELKQLYGNVLLLKDNGVTQEETARVLMQHIPGMSAEMANELTAQADTMGLAIIGQWKLELAEAYMRVLRSRGLQSQMLQARSIPEMQMPEAPERVVIPDTFNPAEWSKRGGGLGEGGGLGGSGVNFGNDGGVMEREKEGKNVAVLDRPPAKGDPGKKYRLLLFSGGGSSMAHATKVLKSNIPGMTESFAREIATRAWNTGMGMVGIWTYELAEAYMDLLRNNGLQADIEED